MKKLNILTIENEPKNNYRNEYVDNYIGITNNEFIEGFITILGSIVLGILAGYILYRFKFI